MGPKDEADPLRKAGEGAAGQLEGRAVSRRQLLKHAGLAGAGASFLPLTTLTSSERAPAVVEPLQTPAVMTSVEAVRESLETLTAAEAETLDAVVARLIPTDENGPGATEARAAHYVDRALGGPLASSREAYAMGLAAIERYAQASKGAAFTELSARDQDAVLSDMEHNVAHGFTPSASAVFEMLRAHTLQGMFGDPYYGGNANFIGWDLIGYPGVRMVVPPEMQQIDADATPNHKSAYDYPMWTKKGTGHGH